MDTEHTQVVTEAALGDSKAGAEELGVVEVAPLLSRVVQNATASSSLL
jgi:hypothetical protein